MNNLIVIRAHSFDVENLRPVLCDCFFFFCCCCSQQAEEEYNEAKSVYTKLHAELYEELPALFDR